MFLGPAECTLLIVSHIQYSTNYINYYTDEKWLGNHHHYNEDVDIHVFGVAGPPLESPNNKATWDIDIDIPVGPVILKVRVMHILLFSQSNEILAVQWKH